MRICIDLDGTIAQNKKNNEDYSSVKPVPFAVQALNNLKKQGFYIIIYTARHMGTCNSNVGKVIALQGLTTINWLNKYQIPYDEILFGKPNVDYFIDDKGIGFEDWPKTEKFLLHKLNNV